MVWQWIHLVTKGAQWKYLEKYLKIFWYTQDLFCYIVQIFCILVWRLHKTDFITSIMAIVAKMFFQHRYLMIKVSHANLVPVPQTYKRLKDYINQTNYSTVAIGHQIICRLRDTKLKRAIFTRPWTFGRTQLSISFIKTS